MRTRPVTRIGSNRRRSGPSGGGTAPVALGLTSGVVAYYALTNNGNDSSPNARNMTLAGATYGTGILDQDLVSSSADTAAYVATLGACSISAWFFFDATSAAQVGNMGFRSGATKQLEFSFSRISVSASLAVAGGGAVTFQTSIATAAWHHVVCTSDGGGVIRTYFDGAFAANVAGSTGGLTVDTVSLAANIRVFIDEVGFWSRELTVANIASLWNGGLGKNPYV